MPKDSEFVVGDKTYQCPGIIAAFIAPRIARLYTTDLTVNEYCLQMEDPGQQFTQFLSLVNGSNIQATDENRPFLLSVARELENSEVYFSIFSQMEHGLCVEYVSAIGGRDPHFFEMFN
jgi:hypothetical protein